MQARELLAAGARALPGSASPELDSELMLAHVLQLGRSQLLAHPELEVGWWPRLRYSWYLWRRACGVPVAYLVGWREFYGRRFRINPATLIPRPDTESVVEAVLGTIRANGTITTAVDVGTGSGCIAVTLAAELPRLKVVATDVSEGALRLALSNALCHGVAQRVTFLRGNLLEPLLATSSPLSHAIIVANLPYLRPDEVVGELRREPQRAVVGGSDGLAYYRELFTQLSRVPREEQPRYLALELHPPTAQQAAGLLKNIFPGCQAVIVPDTAGRPRVLTVTLA